MNYLGKLNPAHIIIIQEGDGAYDTDLLKATLLDLLLKQVLKTEHVTRQASANDPVMSYDYIGIGPAFYDYKYDEYEKVYLSPFLKNSSLQVLFRKLVRIGYENAKTVSNFPTRVAKSFIVKPYIKRNIFQLILGGFTLTAAGLLARDEVNTEIEQLELRLVDTTDSLARIELLKPIYGNILLLKGLPDGFFAEFDAVLAQQFSNGNDEGTYGGGCSGWGGIDHYTDGFDSGCGAHGHGCGGSGCSGCSGCGGSGCSGCGGGGCGGGD